MLARNWDLCWLATSSAWPLSRTSWNSLAFSTATAAWEAKVSRRPSVLREMGRWLGAYMYGKTRDQLL
jgi:hypothetical protein